MIKLVNISEWEIMNSRLAAIQEFEIHLRAVFRSIHKDLSDLLGDQMTMAEYHVLKILHRERLPADYRFGPRSGRLFEPCHQRDRSTGRQGMRSSGGGPSGTGGPSNCTSRRRDERGWINCCGRRRNIFRRSFPNADGNDSHPERSVEAPDLKTKRWRGSDGTLK